MSRSWIFSVLVCWTLLGCGLGLRPRLSPEESSELLKVDAGSPDSPQQTSTRSTSESDGGLVETFDGGWPELPAGDPCEKGKVLCKGQCVNSELMLPECEPTWVEVKPSFSPKSASGYPMFYDEERKELLLKTATVFFRFTGNTWTRVSEEGPQVINMRAVFDSHRRKTFVFGEAEMGKSAWDWNGARWTQRENGPGAVGDFAMAFDSLRGRVVACGTLWGTDRSKDVWEWDNLSWTSSSTPLMFRETEGMSGAYDAARKQIVLFGGFSQKSSRFGQDTWVSNGSVWIKKSPTRRPLGRHGASMAYDLHRHRVVLFGGEPNDSGDSDEVWEWDGENWLQKLPNRGPSKRRYSNFVYNPHRQRFVLHGGGPSGFGSFAQLNDMWELVFP